MSMPTAAKLYKRGEFAKVPGNGMSERTWRKNKCFVPYTVKDMKDGVGNSTSLKICNYTGQEMRFRVTRRKKINKEGPEDQQNYKTIFAVNIPNGQAIQRPLHPRFFRFSVGEFTTESTGARLKLTQIGDTFESVQNRVITIFGFDSQGQVQMHSSEADLKGATMIYNATGRDIRGVLTCTSTPNAPEDDQGKYGSKSNKNDFGPPVLQSTWIEPGGKHAFEVPHNNLICWVNSVDSTIPDEGPYSCTDNLDYTSYSDVVTGIGQVVVAFRDDSGGISSCSVDHNSVQKCNQDMIEIKQ